MMQKNYYFTAIILILISTSIFASERVASIHYIVRLEHRLVNEAPQSEDIELFISIPQNNERQEIIYFYPEPGFTEIITDEYGNQILHFVDKAVPPGEVVTHGWMAEVRLFSCLYDKPAILNSKIKLKPEQEHLFLKDASNYQINSPIIQDLVKKLTPGTNNRLDLAKRFFEHLIYEVNYERDLVWDPAPMVIQRKSGSCSEYNYAFLSLCRAAKIPGRYTGGIILKQDDATSYDANITEDAVFHRWSEIFLNGIGWYPIDCSRGSGELKRFGNPYNQFGRLPSGVLQTMHGDGAGSSPLGWDYLSNCKINFKTSDKESKVGYWIKPNAVGELQKQTQLVEKKLQSTHTTNTLKELLSNSLSREIVLLHQNEFQPKEWPDLVESLYHVHHPEAIYWDIRALKRSIGVSFHQTYPFMVDEDLTNAITRYLNGDEFNLVEFEYWWRKARPKIKWDDEKQAFILTDKNLNLF
ncbi:transglutaminase domain-containing protein [candidate division KSB1 bacterium]|nr:transglutaminase domain-containing protein [candidate division KSB1 bacterium]